MGLFRLRRSSKVDLTAWDGTGGSGELAAAILASGPATAPSSAASSPSASGAASPGAEAAATKGSPSKLPGPRRPGGPHTTLLVPTLVLAAVFLVLFAPLVRDHRRRGSLANQLLAATRHSHYAGGPAKQLAAHERSAAACGEALQLPQVALLFLTKGEVRHEAMWREWFSYAAGQVPVDFLSSRLCSDAPGAEAERQRLATLEALQLCAAQQQSATAEQPSAEPRAASAPHGSATSAPSPSTQQWPQRGGTAGQRQAGSAPAADAVANGSGAVALGRRLRQWARRGAGSPSGSAGSTARVLPDTLAQQHLFDVYVHPHPSFKGFPAGSLFAGRELPPEHRVETNWGDYTLVEAAKALLGAALQNPRNQKFLLLSESDLPLYSPHVLYAQVASERLSRLNACNTTDNWDLNFYRWVDRMETDLLKQHVWRKSWQWFGLNREHAEIVVADTELEAVFKQHCRTTWEQDRGEERVCYSDEHYIPTLLAIHGRDNETDCQGQTMDIDWDRVESTSPHPWEYHTGEVRESLFEHLRRPERSNCSLGGAALLAAPQRFATAHEAAADGGAGFCMAAMDRPAYPQLGGECPLVARKFLDWTVKPALMAMAPCDSNALILNDGSCGGAVQAQQRRQRMRWQEGLPPVLLALGLLLAPPLVGIALGLLLGPRGIVPGSSRRISPRELGV